MSENREIVKRIPDLLPLREKVRMRGRVFLPPLKGDNVDGQVLLSSL